MPKAHTGSHRRRAGKPLATAQAAPRVVWDDRSLDPKMLSASDEQVYALLGVAAPAPADPSDATPSAAQPTAAVPDQAPAAPRIGPLPV